MPVTNFDIWDSAQLTGMVQRSLTTSKENTPSLAEQIAPFVDVQARKVKFRISEVDAFGVGELRAPDGNPRLYRSAMTWRDEMIELALPDEMERISEDTMLRLQSSDPNIKNAAGIDVVTRGTILGIRNYRRVEKMRWQMILTGKVKLDYDDSGAEIDYGIPPDHFVNPSTVWTDTTNADIVAHVRAWQKKLGDDAGQQGLHMYMNSDTWDLVYNNAKIRALLSSYGRSLLVPTREDVARLFREGTQITIYDGGYRDTGATGRGDSSLTKWLPDYYVLFTTDLVMDGFRVADTPNGQVMIATGYNSATAVQGPASETILDPISKNTFLRYARAAIPRLLQPECLLIAKVDATS